jgi:hypothetical protein
MLINLLGINSVSIRLTTFEEKLVIQSGLMPEIIDGIMMIPL